jgi:hypothetical protein
MPIKIVEFEISKPLERLRRLEYQIYDIWGLVRLHGYPIGWVRIGNNQLPISARELTELVANTYSKNIYSYALRSQLINGQGLSTGENLIATAFNPPPEPVFADYSLITALLWISEKVNLKFVTACLEALKKQDHPNYEIIIGYNNRPPTELTTLANNMGVSLIAGPKAFQQAVLVAKGEFVSITGQMAVPDNGWLRAVADMGKDPTAVAITGPFLPLELENQPQLDFYRKAQRPDWFSDYYSYGEGYNYKVENLGIPLNTSYRNTFLQEYCYHPMFDKGFDLKLMLHLYYIALWGESKIGYASRAIVWERYPTDEKTLSNQLKQERAARLELFINALYRGKSQRKTLAKRVIANPESKTVMANMAVRKIRNKFKRTDANRS